MANLALTPAPEREERKMVRATRKNPRARPKAPPLRRGRRKAHYTVTQSSITSGSSIMCKGVAGTRCSLMDLLIK